MEKLFSDIFHLVTTNHITYLSEWVFTGYYKGAVNNTSGKYWTNNDAKDIILKANELKVKPADVWENVNERLTENNDRQILSFDKWMKKYPV